LSHLFGGKEKAMAAAVNIAANVLKGEHFRDLEMPAK
jgi:hypothetical protein